MNATFTGLCLLWLGAAGFGGLLILRGRWEQAVRQGRAIPRPSARKTVEAGLTFAGTGGMILGLGVLGLSVMR
ncbi:MAG: hypothetical protein WCZ23_01345 [Rhodospirillaceae bacterium]